MKLRYLLLMMGLAVALTACSVHVGGRPHPHYAPPPQVEWRWDPGIDAYVVLGWPHLYYRDRIYYRWHDNGWYSSPRHDGPWTKGPRGVPPGLNKKYGKQGRGHGGGGY